VNAFLGEWHVAHAIPLGVDRLVSKKRAFPTEAFVTGPAEGAIPPPPPQLINPTLVPTRPIPKTKIFPIRSTPPTVLSLLAA
jgi:hypothetical protein